MLKYCRPRCLAPHVCRKRALQGCNGYTPTSKGCPVVELSGTFVLSGTLVLQVGISYTVLSPCLLPLVPAFALLLFKARSLLFQMSFGVRSFGRTASTTDDNLSNGNNYLLCLRT